MLEMASARRAGGGGNWIRTSEGKASRFTVCPRWPLGYPTTAGEVRQRRGPRLNAKRMETLKTFFPKLSPHHTLETRGDH